MKRLCAVLLCALACALFASPALAAEVSQGKVLAWDAVKLVVTIEDYDLDFTKDHPFGKPTGQKSVYDCRSALIGVPPAVGDVIRIAYHVKGTERVALKVMNVTKQSLRK